MTNKQTRWILERLMRYGRITRNRALNRKIDGYPAPITRLAGEINYLKTRYGYQINGGWIKTKNGTRDYEYRLVR